MAKRKNTRTKSSGVRIIAGKWRGRRISVATADGLRPTTDRVRETLFNWLMTELPGTNCLDLFAGSGVLGFECLSRGAHSVQFVEANKEVARTLRSSMDALSDEKTQYGDQALFIGDARKFLLQDSNKVFDLVFLDPPFSSTLIEPCIELLENNHWLVDNAVIYLEQSSQDGAPAVPDNWALYREGVAGESHYSLYRRS
jgi:16S rRNA (guanine966-N2)-methyltransferase